MFINAEFHKTGGQFRYKVQEKLTADRRVRKSNNLWLTIINSKQKSQFQTHFSKYVEK